MSSGPPNDSPSEPITPVARFGFWLGLVGGGAIVAFAGFIPPPEGLSAEALRLIGITFLVGVWWITEAIPLGATALVPAATFPLFGICSARDLASSYGSSLVLLLLGGFVLALAVERSRVHRRLSIYVLLTIGASPRRLVLGFAVASAVMSMWISNTATTLIMMPIAIAIVDRATEADPEAAPSFGLAVMLATAYGASVGGMGTPVGTTPNLIAISALERTFPDGPTLTFPTWAQFALPVVIVMVPLIWLALTRVYPRVPKDLALGARAVLRDELARLGAWRPSEVRALAVFATAAVLWVTRPDFELGGGKVIRGWASALGISGADDATVAMLAAVLAFAIPSGDGDRERLLPWREAIRLPWGLILLFGGGVALSVGFVETGLSTYLGDALGRLAGGSTAVFLAATTLAATFGTEIVSNTALANILMPIIAAAAKAAMLDPRGLLVPVALACSCAFMMPAATGPNAIVFGTGRVRIAHMVRAGFLINLLAWACIVGWGLVMAQ